MNDHPDAATIERFTIGAMDAPAENAFAEHVSACDACGEKLAREARLELALGEVHALRAAERTRPVEHRTASVTRLLFPVLVVAAAAVFLFLRAPRPARSDVGADPSVVVLAPSAVAGAASGGPPDSPVLPSDADAVIAKMRPGLRSCYQSALATDPATSGKGVLLARVAPDGNVRDVDIDATEGLTRDLVACLRNVVLRGHFRGTGSTTTVPVAVSFVRN